VSEETHRRRALPRGDLVAGCLRGEEGAWEALVRSRARLVYAVIRRLGFGEDEAAELFHQVWLTAWERLDTLGDERELDVWLTTLAARQAKRALRQRV
jgi:DNA-directed RNA polymerase specialized sigma24 family protein